MKVEKKDEYMGPKCQQWCREHYIKDGIRWFEFWERNKVQRVAKQSREEALGRY